MALKKIYIEGVPGLTFITHSDLHGGSEVMLVLREGKPLAETSGVPTGRFFRHNGSATRIDWDAQIPIQIMDGVPEIIYVEYKN